MAKISLYKNFRRLDILRKFINAKIFTTKVFVHENFQIYGITKNNLLPEAICCCLQTCNVTASEKIVGARCVPSLVINSIINKLESKVSLITTRCLRLFVVVYRVEML